MPSSFERGYAIARARARGDVGASLDDETAILDAASPRGLFRIHSSWYELPPDTDRAEVRDYLARLHLGHLVSMDVRDEGILRILDGLTFGELESVVRSLGRRRMAVALVETSRPLVAQICARLGEPEGTQLLEDITAVRGRATRAEVRALQRAWNAPIPAKVDQLSLEGVTWIAGVLVAFEEDAVRRLAQRLPRPIGEALLALRLLRDRADPVEERALMSCLDALLPKLPYPV